MTYARFTINGQETEKLYFCWEEFITDTFNPDTRIDCIINFSISGKGYKARKENLHCLAVNWSNNGDVGHLYMSDLGHISNWFYRNGKRYGLLEEFRENAII